MQYMMLIYVNESLEGERSEEDFNKLYQEYVAFDEKVKAMGKVKSTAALQPTSTATTVRVRDGKPVITDGPFAETKEALGGYYLLECDDLDEAIELAAQIPDAKYGTIEIRPKMTFE